MTDLALRQLGRAASSGDPQDEARALLARVRAGTLTRERLELAAYSGHGAARLALDPFPPERSAPWGRDTPCLLCVAEDGRNYTFPGQTGLSWHCLKHADDYPSAGPGCEDLWLSGLLRWGPGVLVRAAWYVLDVAMDHVSKDTVLWHSGREASLAAWEWVTCPCEVHRRRCSYLLRDGRQRGQGPESLLSLASAGTGPSAVQPGDYRRHDVGVLLRWALQWAPLEEIHSTTTRALSAWALEPA